VQQVGRAGRDGLRSDCILFHAPTDEGKSRSILLDSARKSNASDEYIKALITMNGYFQSYLDTVDCRRQFLLGYFGDDAGAAAVSREGCMHESGAAAISVLTMPRQRARITPPKRANFCIRSIISTAGRASRSLAKSCAGPRRARFESATSIACRHTVAGRTSRSASGERSVGKCGIKGFSERMCVHSRSGRAHTRRSRFRRRARHSSRTRALRSSQRGGLPADEPVVRGS